jgi:hypothetical protein
METVTWNLGDSYMEPGTKLSLLHVSDLTQNTSQTKPSPTFWRRVIRNLELNPHYYR